MFGGTSEKKTFLPCLPGTGVVRKEGVGGWGYGWGRGAKGVSGGGGEVEVVVGMVCRSAFFARFLGVLYRCGCCRGTDLEI